ncbi:MAG TPA: hypothetical protein VGV38_15930, partial [Pyrinomonadaceae bacterium]|nr:hypothetical protein [Pyrinomonadaceae bacterium]
AEQRALRRAVGDGRIAATWYNVAEFSLDINLADGQDHQLALYFLDWEGVGRAVRLEVSDASTGALLDARDLSEYAQGKYAVWNVRGRVRVRVVNTGASNAVVSGVFFSPVSSTPPPTPTPTPTPGDTSAAFVRTDSTTQGNWPGVYGADGREIVNDSINYPAYAQVTTSGALAYTWLDSTTESRALQRANGGRIASTWYNWSEFSLDVNITDGQEHQIALYFLDWEGVGRAARVEISDASTGALLDSRNVSEYAQGKYAVWNVRGRVRVRVVNTGASNAVLSGVFFGPAG